MIDDGRIEGKADGTDDGLIVVGIAEGLQVGHLDGFTLGKLDGNREGKIVGLADGEFDGNSVG